MQTITLVTGNKGKLAEWQRLFPASIKLEAADIDLDEIQSLDLEAIVKDKACRAYEQVKSPVIVEDISAGLDRLGGMPGPFIKFFEHQLGLDALFQLSKLTDGEATVICYVAYFDGTNFLLGRGEVKGKAVAARGSNGFGFDIVFQPDGSNRTYAEMESSEKDKISHRSVAVRDLVNKLKQQSELI